MENLVSKTLKFFFVPEAALAVLFLLVFVVLFGVGMYWARNCRKVIEHLRDNAETEYENVRAKMSPDLFIKKYLNKISSTESKLEGVPEAFVSIGIVATFLGLGVAIQGSAELLENEKLELAKLTAVLGVIAFKFQTSVWGICFSLIFRSTIVDRYFDFRQETIDYVNDLLYTIERDSIRTLLEKQNDFFIEQQDWRVKAESERAELLINQHKTSLSENRQLVASLFEMLTEYHEDNLRESQRISKLMAEKFDESIEQLKFLANHLNTFIKTAKTFTESTKQFSDRVDLFRKEITKVLQDGFEKIKVSNENLGKLHEKHIEEIHTTQKENISKLTEELISMNSEHEKNMYYFTEKLDELHQKFYLDSKKYVEDTQLILADLLEKTIDKINDGYIREAAEIRETISKLNDTLSIIESRVNLANDEFINHQNQFANEWRNVSESAVDTLQKVASTVNENSTQVIQTYNNLQAVTTSIQNLVTNSTQKLTDITQDANKNFAKVLTDFNNAFKDFGAVNKDFTKAVDSNLATLSISQKFNIDNLKAVTKESTQKFADTLESFIAAQKNDSESLAKSQQAMTENLAAISDTLKQILKLQEEISVSSNKPLSNPPTPSSTVNIARSTINTLRPAKKHK